MLSYQRYRARKIECGSQPTGSGFNPRKRRVETFTVERFEEVVNRTQLERASIQLV